MWKITALVFTVVSCMLVVYTIFAINKGVQLRIHVLEPYIRTSCTRSKRCTHDAHANSTHKNTRGRQHSYPCYVITHEHTPQRDRMLYSVGPQTRACADDISLVDSVRAVIPATPGLGA